MFVLENQKTYAGHQQFSAIVQLIGSRRQAEGFKYRLELNGHRRSLIWEATPRSIREGMASAIHSSDCLIFDILNVQLIGDNSSLRIKVTISMITPGSPEQNMRKSKSFLQARLERFVAGLPSYEAERECRNQEATKEIDSSGNLKILQDNETTPNLPVGSIHQAIITFVEDGPYSFFLQIKANADRYLPQLKHVLSKNTPLTINKPLVPGRAVMAKSLVDNSLRRGVAVGVISTRCKIYFTDYGTVEDLPLNNIFILPEGADTLCPPLAIKLRLAKLEKIKLTQPIKDHFADLVLGKVVEIKITEAVPRKPDEFLCDMRVDSTDMFETLFNLTKPLEYSYSLPPCEMDDKVTISFIQSPAQFYIHYSSTKNLLDEILEEVETYCKDKPRLNDINSIRIGSPIGCLFHEDNHWYRALVAKIDKNRVDVIYVDYGNEDSVEVNKLVELSSELVFKWRTHAVECCLTDFENKQPSEAVGNMMRETFEDGEFDLKINSMLFGNKLSIDLSNEHYKSISQHLLEAENKIIHDGVVTENCNLIRRMLAGADLNELIEKLHAKQV